MNMLSLEDVATEIRRCRRCDLANYRTHVVPGEGPADAEVMFIGEAPGRKEDLSGRPKPPTQKFRRENAWNPFKRTKKPEKSEKEGKEDKKEKPEEEKKKEGKVEDIPLPEVNFANFILSLSTSALLHLGEIPHPVSQKKEENFPLAKHTIDTVGMLKEKTEGNITKEEENLIENILYDLRMKYVKKNKE